MLFIYVLKMQKTLLQIKADIQRDREKTVRKALQDVEKRAYERLRLCSDDSFAIVESRFIVQQEVYKFTYDYDYDYKKYSRKLKDNNTGSIEEFALSFYSPSGFAITALIVVAIFFLAILSIEKTGELSSENIVTILAAIIATLSAYFLYFSSAVSNVKLIQNNLRNNVDKMFNRINENWREVESAYARRHAEGVLIEGIDVKRLPYNVGMVGALELFAQLATTLYHLNMRHMPCAGMVLTHGEYQNIELISADCRYTDFTSSDFTNADLRWTNFSNANLEGCIFTGANILEANFDGALLDEGALDATILEREDKKLEIDI